MNIVIDKTTDGVDFLEFIENNNGKIIIEDGINGFVATLVGPFYHFFDDFGCGHRYWASGSSREDAINNLKNTTSRKHYTKHNKSKWFIFRDNTDRTGWFPKFN